MTFSSTNATGKYVATVQGRGGGTAPLVGLTWLAEKSDVVGTAARYSLPTNAFLEMTR